MQHLVILDTDIRCPAASCKSISLFREKRLQTQHASPVLLRWNVNECVEKCVRSHHFESV